MLARLQRALDRLVDPLLALALLAIGAVEIWIENGQVAGPRGANTIFLLLVTVPLAWRRRRPLAVLAIVTAGAIGWNYVFYVHDQPPLEPFLAVLLVVFSAASAAPRRSPAVPAAAAAYIVSGIPALASGVPPGDIVPAWIFLGFVWGLGGVVHRQRALAVALAERASQLEAEREERARLAVALERARIARELHDVVTHNVSVMVVQAGVEGRALGHGGSGSTREALGTIERVGRDTLVELRRLLGVLRKSDDRPALAPQPTLERLEDLAHQVREAGLPVALRVEGERAPLPAGVELSAYRIVQEALTNSLKHAGPAHAEIVVRYRAAELELEVSDDGRGPRNGTRPGNGLLGMRERVALHRGALEAGGDEGGGFRVHARLPLEESGR